MPVPIPGLKVGSDNQKVKFLTIFGRPKTGIFRGVPGRAPLATNHAALPVDRRDAGLHGGLVPVWEGAGNCLLYPSDGADDLTRCGCVGDPSVEQH